MTHFNKLTEKYKALETRQRIMLFGGCMAALLLVFELSWYRDEHTAQQQLKRNLAQVLTERTDALNAIEQRQRELAGIELSAKRQSLKQLLQQESKVDQQLKTYTYLVEPKQMPSALRAFFETTTKLKLIRLETLPIQSAFESDKNNDLKDTNSPTQLFRHDFRMTFTGRYFDILDALIALEKNDLRFYWNVFEYDASSYPIGEVTLTLFTYSYHEYWIGV